MSVCLMRRVVGPCGTQVQPEGRCARLGILRADVVLTVNGTDISACAEASCTSHYLTARKLLREAPFPLQVSLAMTRHLRISPV